MRVTQVYTKAFDGGSSEHTLLDEAFEVAFTMMEQF